MRYAIENENGQWWTGTCWGVSQARETYEKDELPSIIGEDEGEGVLLEDGEHYAFHANVSFDPSGVTSCWRADEGDTFATATPVRISHYVVRESFS